MLNKDTYNIGKKYNDITKYNIDFDRKPILDYMCALFILELLDSNISITTEQHNKLQAIINNLIVL